MGSVTKYQLAKIPIAESQGTESELGKKTTESVPVIKMTESLH